MKRSVAINNIVNVLRLTGNHYCDDGRDMQDAKRILNRMEALGMLPPFFPPEKLSVMQDEKKYTQYYAWEPENE